MNAPTSSGERNALAGKLSWAEMPARARPDVPGRSGNGGPERAARWAMRTTLVLAALIGGPGKGALHAQTDTTKLYKTIQDYSERHTITRWIYDGIFVPPGNEAEPPPSAPVTRRVNPFLRDEGRIVRRIEVRTFDPFGYSVDDTTLTPVNALQTWADRLHRKTRPRIVRNLLLVRPLQPLDPLKVAESERVLRASPFVNDARILVRPVHSAPDSVDLIVLVHDKWSIDVDGEADLTSASVRLREKNFLGLGQALEQRVGYRLGIAAPDLAGEHAVYNIGRSYVSSRVLYVATSELDQFGFALDRPFYSPLAKWAGGLAWMSNATHYEVLGPEGAVLSRYGLEYSDADLWLGRSFRLGDGRSMGSRSSNVVLAARYAQRRFADRPPLTVDSARFYSDNTLFLVSTGLSIRQYYKERYLFRFGNAEDVPEGLLIRLTGGVQRRELTVNAPYAGAEVSRGRNYAHFGYFSAGVGYGTFFERGVPVDGTFRAQLLYFTDLLSMGRWHFRQFARFKATFGHAKPSYATIDLNGAQLYGFSSSTLKGTHKEVFSTETVCYAPVNLWGFRIAPVLLMGFGTIGAEHDPLFSGRIYSAYSLGLLVRNENLLVRTFEVTVGFFPYLPDSGGSRFEFNSFGSYSSRAMDFTFPEPATVAFD